MAVMEIKFQMELQPLNSSVYLLLLALKSHRLRARDSGEKKNGPIFTNYAILEMVVYRMEIQCVAHSNGNFMPYSLLK